MFKNCNLAGRVTFFILCVSLLGCKSNYIIEPFSGLNIPPKPNYSNDNNWAVLPSVDSDYLKDFLPNSYDSLKADVFYVYPTLITSKRDIRWNVSISDLDQREKVLNKAVKLQASAWLTSGKLYVPFYRQAHLKSYSNLDKGGKKALLLAYSDIKDAFKTYLKKYNNGRPIIIASHSQGTTHTRRILKEFFDGKPLQKQLIAAYIIGIGIPENEFETIKLMGKPDETGGFVSWNTYKRNKYPKKYNNWYKGKVTTNPITWNNASETRLEDHKGFLFSNEKLYTKALKIEIIDGLVWSTNPKFPKRLLMSFLKNYHAGDINLFWKDIQENAELRTKAWFDKKNQN